MRNKISKEEEEDNTKFKYHRKSVKSNYERAREKRKEPYEMNKNLIIILETNKQLLLFVFVAVTLE